MSAKIALLGLALLGVVGFSNAEDTHPGQAPETPEAAGRALLLSNCAQCHAIDKEGKSPLADAPPFRDVMQRYDPSQLEEALAEGIVTGHNQMPEFVFEPDQIAEIIAYLTKLRSN